MTDLEINIALAKAMGWVEVSKHEWLFSNKVVGFLIRGDSVVCVTCSNELDENDEKLYLEKIFDYRDPVIFVAICKHWKLRVNHARHWVSGDADVWINAGFGTIEKAAALCVIELAKRGVK